MNKKTFKKFLTLSIVLFPVFILSYFFLTSKFILLDDHEIYRLHFKEINIFTTVLDDWKYLYRFRPFYWIVRQLESIFFGINPLLWYITSLAFFAATIIALFLFFKNIGYRSFLAITFTWASVLGYQSIATWMALGIQEGLGLCLFSCSLYQLSLHGLNRVRKNFIYSVIYFFLSFLVKETFFFLTPFLVVLVLWQERSFSSDFFFKSFILSLGSFFMIPIIIFQSWRSREWIGTNENFLQNSFFKTENMISFLTLIQANYHLVLAFSFFIISGLLLIVKNIEDKKNVVLITTFILCSLGIGSQLLIYSFTEYVAPHYIQPVSMIIILSLSFILKYYSLSVRLILGIMIFLILPITFFHTIEYANSHNFQSRMLYEIEKQVLQSSVIVLVGHRSNEHEKIFSFFKRINYLYPDKEIYFYHYTVSSIGESNNKFDIVSDTSMIEITSNQLDYYPLIVSFSSENFLKEFSFIETNLKIEPIIENIRHNNTWYIDAPSLIFQ